MAKQLRLTTALALTLALAGPAFAEGETASTVVATVNGTEITLGQMIALRENLPEEFQSLPDDTLYKAVLDQLVHQELLSQSAANLPVTPRVTANIRNNELAYHATRAMEKLIAEGVTDAAIEATYEELMKDVAPVTEYAAAHILVDSEEKANELKKQIEEGADFAELAKANSADPGSAAAGGDLGWFEPERMVKSFADAVTGAEQGKITGPVKSEFGWHLVLVRDKREIKRPTLEDARSEVAAEVERRLINAEVEKLTAAAKIEKPGAELDPSLIKNSPLID